MGGTSSKGQVINSSPAVAQRPPEPTYHGPSAQYQFVNVDVSMTTQMSFNFYQGSMVCSNVDTYYPALQNLYNQGYRMLTFYHIPGQAKHAGGFFNPSVLMPFQGIFCRYPTAPSNERYQLHIEKSVIQTQMVFNGFLTTRSQTVTNTNHFFETVANFASRGGRLICIELTGQTQEQRQNFGSMVPQMPVKGCDLFFEMPLHPPQETYIYNVVSQPIIVTVRAGFNPVPIVQCDWNAVLAANLGQGWKLVEIFLDETSSSQSRGFTATSSMNSQWYFEKPASRANDPTPVYQGTVVEHLIQIRQAGFSGVKTDTLWEPVIQNMGNNGWELACILETPEQKVSGFAKVCMKVLLFFQRKIIPDQPGAYQPPVAAAMPQPALPPPSYNTLQTDPNLGPAKSS